MAERSQFSLSRTQRRVIALAVVGICVAGAATWLVVRQDDSPMRELSSRMGADELRQLYGTALDAGSDTVPDVSDVADEVATIRGQVLRPNGEPAPGARVAAYTRNEIEPFETVANAGGFFSFGELPAGLYTVEATLEGFGPAFLVGVSPGTGRLRLLLHGGRTLRGRVTMRGEPVVGATVHIGGAGLFPQRDAQTDGNGLFEVAGLRPGRYELGVTADGAGDGFETEVVVDEEPGAAELSVEIPLRYAADTTLEIIDRRDGSIVPGGIITIARGPLYVLSISLSAEEGTTSIDFLPWGYYYVRVRAPGYLPATRKIRIGSSRSVVQVPLSRGATIAGRVTDLAGNGLPRVSLRVVLEGAGGDRWELKRNVFDEFHRLVRPDGSVFWPPSFGFITGPEGEYNLAGIPAGEAFVVAEAEGFAPAISDRLTLSADAVYEGVDLRLEPGRAIRGRVEDAGGGAVQGATVTARSAELPGWVSGRSVSTSSVGIFALEDMTQHTVLDVRHPDFSPVELPVEVPDSGLDDLVIRMSSEQLPVVSGRLFDADGAAASGGRVWIMHGDSDLPACRAIVGADGWFVASHCTAAPERLIAAAPGHAPLIRDLGGDLEPRDWTLSKGGELELVSQRTPVVTSVDPLFQLPRALWSRPVVDLERWSRARLEHVAPGRYRVTCRAEGREDEVVDVEVAADQRTEALCPSLDRLETFRIWVVDNQGAPVSDALLMVDGLDPNVRTLTSDEGYVEITTTPGRWVVAEAFHEGWGRGASPFYLPRQPADEPFRVRLDTGIAGEDPEAFIAMLEEWGIAAVVDGRSVVIDRIEPGTPAAGNGLRRYDYLLWAKPLGERRLSIGVRRSGNLLTFEFAREREDPAR